MSLVTLLDQSVSMGVLQRSLGLSVEVANGLYGEYSFALTLFALPPSFIYPVSISLVPAVSAALCRQDRAGAGRCAAAALRATALLALPAGVGLSVMAGPILHLLYPARPEEAAAAAWHLSVLGVASVFVCLMVASSGILQAYGREKLPVWTLLAGGAVKIAASIALVSRPDIGIHGAPISTLLCYGLIAALNLGAIRRSIPAQVRLGEIFGKPLVMTAVMARDGAGGLWPARPRGRKRRRRAGRDCARGAGLRRARRRAGRGAARGSARPAEGRKNRG